MNTATQPMYEWNTIPWSQAERAVFKLQKRIYQASARDDTKTVHQLQRLLMRSWWACLLAVRRVTQDNQGKNTAGVDGVKRLTTYATNDALDAIALIQSKHRRATGERIPVWKVVNDAILTYAEKQGIRLTK